VKRRSLIAIVTFICISLVQPLAHATERRFQAEGCHAKVSAALQVKDGNAWKVVIAAQGWEAVASCPANNPYTPWAMADIAIGSTIRWHIYAPGAWDWYSSESKVQETFDPSSIAPVTAQADIKPSDYPHVAALARASILMDQPIALTTQKIVYQFENGVPIENQNLIKEGAENFLSRFGNLLNYSDTAIGVIAYKTLPGGLALARAFDPLDAAFQDDMSRTFPKQVDPEKVPRVGMGGFSVGYKRLVVIGAPYFQSSDPKVPTYKADPVVITHELAHEVQASINKGSNMRNPVWLCEGGAQVMGAVMSVYQGKDYWEFGRDQWANRIPANRTIADLKTMEGEDPNLSEYTTGAALSEYLIAWGGFKKSLLVNQISFKLANRDRMSGFRQAFQIVYGQSLDDFYVQALPYINYVSANWKTSNAISPNAVAFIDERLGALKAAEALAAALELKARQDADAKIAADKVAAEKAAAELKAKQDAEAKVAAEKAAAELKAKQDAEAKVAAEKAAAELKAKQDADAKVAAVSKKITITCINGKISKKVTAVKPKCPSGYKLKK
jgi:hypothetical protein